MSLKDRLSGAAQAAKQQIKQQAKKAIMEVIKPALPYIALGILIILIIGVIVGTVVVKSGQVRALTPGFVGIEGNIYYGSNNEETVWLTLRAAGYSAEQVAGIMGNMYYESGFNPSLIEYEYTINNGGIGLVQWTNYPRTAPDGRRTRLIKYAQSQGKEWQDIGVQLEYLMAELKGGGEASYGCSGWGNASHKSPFENSKTVADATYHFLWGFEIPAGNPTVIRTEKAQEYYEKYKNLSATLTGNPGKEGTTTVTYNGKSIQQPTYTSTKGTKRTYICFQQCSAPWSSVGYAGGSIGNYGCPAVSCATILSGYGVKCTPANFTGFYSRGVNLLTDYGAKIEWHSSGNGNLGSKSEYKSKIIKYLQQGYPVLIWVKSPNIFTRSQHWMSLLDVNGNKVYVDSHDTYVKHGWYDIDTVLVGLNGYTPVIK